MKTWKDIQRGEGNDEPPQSEQEVQEADAQAKHDPSTTLVPIEKLLPGVHITTNALVVYRERKQLYDHIVYNYSEAHRRVRELQAAAKRQVGEQQKSEPADVQQPGTVLAMLTKKKQEIAVMHSQDALEAVRVQLGLDQLRDDLLEKLRGKLSCERGLLRLSTWTKEHLGKPCGTIREANELFPHLTQSELAFFALLKELPTWMLLYGTAFDATDLAHKAGFEDFEASARRRVPQQMWGTVHGLTYVLDDYQPERDDRGALESDVYAVLGFTGIREDVQFAEYNYDTKRTVRALVPLMLSNARLYEKVWQASPESLQVGFGRIARLALERTMGEEGEKAASVSLSAAIDTLSLDQRKRFEDERQYLEQTVVQASVYDLARDLMLRADEIVRLVGILHLVPRCLVQEQPFTGFIQPYGASLKFITPDGKIIEQCPFSPLHGREAMETIQSEMDDVGRENRTIAHLFRELFSWVQGSVMDRGSEDELSLSLLEATALKLWVERGVVLQPLPVWSLVPVRDFKKHILDYTLTSKDVITRVTSKIGLAEAQQIMMTLQLPATPLLKQVKRVVKTPAIYSIACLMAGMAIEGTYESDSGTIILMEFIEKLYGDIPPTEKAARSFALLHECGEAVWTMLDEETKARWKKISWPRGVRQRLEKHFLTFYAHHNDEKEDFCDHFAAYVLHGAEFRVAAGSAKPLKRKYRLMRHVVALLTGSATEYPRFVPWTIREIHGALQQELERMKLEDAIAFEEQHIAESWKENVERIFEIRKTFEHLIAQEDKAADAEDIEDPEERKLAEQDDEDEDEEYEEEIETEEGYIEMHEIRAYITEVLESVVGREEQQFRSLRDEVTKCLLKDDWDGIESVLDFLGEDDKEEVMSLLREIDTDPQNLYY